MLMTVENLTAENLDVGYPINRTLGPNGDPDDTVTLGVSPEDLNEGDAKGKPAIKDLNMLVQLGKARIAFAEDPADQSVGAELGAVGAAFHEKIAISFETEDLAVLFTVPAGKRLQLEMILWETTADWTGGAVSAIGLSSDQAPHDTAGDLLGGAAGDVAAGLTAALGVHQGTIGTSYSAAPEAVFLEAGSTVIFNRIVDAFTAGTGFVHLIGRYVS